VLVDLVESYNNLRDAIEKRSSAIRGVVEHVKQRGPSSPSPHQGMSARLLRLLAQCDVVIVTQEARSGFRLELRHRADTTIRCIEGEIARGRLSASRSQSGLPLSVDRWRYY